MFITLDKHDIYTHCMSLWINYKLLQKIMDIVNHILAFQPPFNSDDLDIIRWGGTNTHQFIV